MSALTVAPDHRTLVRDGKPFFWLADTIWSAFTNVTDEEWIAYLDKRAAQGFTVLQLNALAQWDRCGCAFDRYPFVTLDHGKTFDFSSVNDEYFEHARWMVGEAVARGLVPAIVVMWSNYVPDTWASAIISDNVMPEQLVVPVVEKICSTFNEFEPVYIISGDTDWDRPGSLERYRLVTSAVEDAAPRALLAYHIKGRYDVLPSELAEHADVYLYQSGHNLAAQRGAYELAESFLARDPVRPVINSEPCYEQMGYSHMLYGRFRRADVRLACWRSLLAGANAGITYGAHGIWNWQNPDVKVGNALGEGFLQALRHEQALYLEGANDFCFARALVEELGLFGATADQGVLESYPEDVRAARTTRGRLVLYVPSNAALKLHGDLSGATVTCIDLLTRERSVLLASFDAEKELTTVEQGTYLEDAVYVID